MPNTNAPRTIATSSGNISLETEIIDSQRRVRQIPLVDVRVMILPGNVNPLKFYLNMHYKKGMLQQLIF